MWKEKDRSPIIALFQSFKTTRAIILPALKQGRGQILVDHLKNPKTACLLIGNISFFTGDSRTSAAREMMKDVEPLAALMASDNDWNELMKEVWADRLGHQLRTKMSAESLDIDYLRGLTQNIDPEYVLERIDLETVKRLDKRQNMHIPLFFGSSKEFIEKGIGFCIKHDGKVVSMASTYTPFIDEFEIEVQTSDDPLYRRKGLATAVSAALIVYSLEHYFVPHWDAANEASVKLALKLGYTNPMEWDVYYVKPLSS